MSDDDLSEQERQRRDKLAALREAGNPYPNDFKPDARAAEIHQTVEQDGVARMMPHPGGVEIPAGGTVEFTPGGLHVMLIEAEPAGGGEKIRLSLELERAGTIEVEAELMPMGPMEH